MAARRFPRRSPLHLRSPCRQSHGSSGWGGKPIAPAGGSHQSLLSGVHPPFPGAPAVADRHTTGLHRTRSEEHTSELQSLMRISYAVFCLKKKKQKLNKTTHASTIIHK